jgi:hypothetical protein
MVAYLIKQGADIHKGGAAWSTPLAWAKHKEHDVIERMLRNYGAVS